MKKIFIGDINELRNVKRGFIIDFLKPFLNKKGLKEKELIDTYGSYYQRYTIVGNVGEADFCILPFSWNYYVDNGKEKEAYLFIEECKRNKKKLFSFTSGDFGVTPLDKEAIIFRQSGYQSNRLKNQFAMSAFITDPVKVFYDGEFVQQPKGDKAKIGFCGQAVSNNLGYGLVFMMNLYRNLRYYTGFAKAEPQTLYPSTLRRNKILKKLETSDKVESDFIIRDKYRSGAKTAEDQKRTTEEFYSNIKNTHYTVCVRGGGNFSVRLYETLAMGRIPIFINTDCVLPYDQYIDWKKHVVWIEEKEIENIGDIVNDFHNSIDPDDFRQLQINNRQLWLDFLSFSGFHNHIHKLVGK